MDASSDVGRRNFQLEKAFAKIISSKFTISKHQSHIGLITYANLPSLRMRFRQYNTIFGKAYLYHVSHTWASSVTQKTAYGLSGNDISVVCVWRDVTEVILAQRNAMLRA